MRLRQETKFPGDALDAITVQRGEAGADDHPAAHSGVGERRFGEDQRRALEASASAGSYLALTRTWKTGDRIEMTMPMRLRVEAMPDDPKQQAFLYGHWCWRAILAMTD